MELLSASEIESAQHAVCAAMAPTPQKRDHWRSLTFGVALSGGNVDRSVFAQGLSG
jgi:hypothetical protein